MKKIAFVLTGALLSVSTMNVMATNNENVVIESKFDGQKQKVEKEELPQEVIQSLEESEYKNWEIQEAYKVEDATTQEVHYELHLASSEDVQNVKNVVFNEQGEIISEEFGQSEELGKEEQQDLGSEQEVEQEIEQSEPTMEGSEEEIEGSEEGTENQQY